MANTENDVKFYMIENHTLVYVHPRQPNSAWVMASHVTKGAPDTYSWLDNQIEKPKPHEMRTATREDFIAMRVSPEGYNL